MAVGQTSKMQLRSVIMNVTTDFLFLSYKVLHFSVRANPKAKSTWELILHSQSSKNVLADNKLWICSF